MTMALRGGGGEGSVPDDLVLTQSVGRGGAMFGDNVKRVQMALNNVPVEMGGPAVWLDPDGVVGTKTLTAIEDFQQHHFGFKDGRVDVMGKTQAKLSSLQPSKLARMRMAKRYLDDALSAMQAAVARLTTAGLELQSGGGLSGGQNLEHVDLHFDVTKSASPAQVITDVTLVYRDMLSVFARPGGLWGWMAFEAEPFANPGFYAFTYWGGFNLSGQYIGWQRLDTVYLSVLFDTANDMERTTTIIHELAHFVGPKAGHRIDDYAYGATMSPPMRALTPYQKQHNAENFSNFAMQCKFGQHVL